MNRETIIRLAREAGLKSGQHWDKSNMDTAHIERFAAIVAAAEREACAKVCESISPKTEPVPYGDIRWGWKYDCPYAAAIRSRT